MEELNKIIPEINNYPNVAKTSANEYKDAVDKIEELLEVFYKKNNKKIIVVHDSWVLKIINYTANLKI